MLIDIGANLAHDSFDHDRDEVLARAIEHGVTRMVVTGTTVAGSQAAAVLAAQHPGTLYSTAGIHPHHASEYDDGAGKALREIAERPSAVAVGECGLDYFRNYSTPAEQEHAFASQLELAAELGMPVFLHQRDAHDRWLAILTEQRDQLTRAVAHCFTADEAALRDCLELDLYIGITGWICDERRGTHLRELLPMIPADRLMIETDAPYLLPRDLKPKPKTRRNEPCHLAHICRAVAAALNVPYETIAQSTTENAGRFFALDQVNLP